MNVLNPGRGVGHLVNGVGGRKSVCNAADLAVDVDEDVASLDAAFVVQQRCVRLHGGNRIEHRR